MPARSCIVTLLTLAVAAVAELCSIGKIGHVHFAEDPSKSAVLASVCCPETCDRCGGVDCWSQSGGLDCCAKHVYDLGDDSDPASIKKRVEKFQFRSLTSGLGYGVLKPPEVVQLEEDKKAAKKDS